MTNRGENKSLWKWENSNNKRVKYLKILQNGNNKKVKYSQNFTNDKKQLNLPNIIFCSIH